jgi:serine protease Do
MSVTDETRAGTLAPTLLLSLSLAAGTCPALGNAFGYGTPEFPDSLVRVQIKHRFPGIHFAGRLIPYSTVVEINEFSGVVLDNGGHVGLYVGSAWTRIPVDKVEVTVSLPPGDQVPARLLGIDERVSLAVVQIADRLQQGALLGTLSDGRPIRVTGWKDGRWNLARFDMASKVPSEVEVEEELRGSFPEKLAPEFPLEGSLLFDESGRFLGFLTQADRVGLSRSTRLLRVLPAGAVRDSIRQVLTSGGSVRAGWLGVFIKDENRRVEVKDVVDGSPADRAGLQPGDLILKVAGRNIWSRGQFVRLIRWLGPGTQTPVIVEREGRSIELQTRLQSWAESRPPATAWAMEIPRVLGSGSNTVEARNIRFYPVLVNPTETLGLTVEPVTPQLAEFFKVPGGQGLLIKAVLEQSLAGKMGFKAGDVLVTVNGSHVTSSADLSRILMSSRDGLLEVTFVRQGEVLTQRVVTP